jgi:hypothetical protein
MLVCSGDDLVTIMQHVSLALHTSVALHYTYTTNVQACTAELLCKLTNATADTRAWSQCCESLRVTVVATVVATVAITTTTCSTTTSSSSVLTMWI